MEPQTMKNHKLFKNWGTFKKGMDAASIQDSFASHLRYSLSKDQYTATDRDMYTALALTVRDRMIERWIRTQQKYHEHDVRRVYYLSAEYLMGRMLTNNLLNLGIYQETEKALAELGIDLQELAEMEPDMGLGNGGLGRLAACFLDSMATMALPAQGYGIRYEFGLFDQAIRNLGQVELPENWLKFGNPWEIARPEYSFPVDYNGFVKQVHLPDGRLVTEWSDTHRVIGVAYDVPIIGYGNNTVNNLRLWSARAGHEFELQYFQHGDYLKAVEEKNLSENISKVLYPNDQIYAGKELRLKQQYFFVSCTIQDIIRRYLHEHQDFSLFADKTILQLNDTHPSLAIAELMRLLLDRYAMSWEHAWDITRRVFAYTNHTLLAEALEKWPVSMLETMLPRHLTIIYELNRRFLRDVATVFLNDTERMKRMSLIEEEPEKMVRMAHLAIVGARSVNGVAELHSRLLRERELKDFYEMYPERFNNKTNGVTPRRWLLAANPALSGLITSRIGNGWVTDLEELKRLDPLTDPPVADEAFVRQWQSIKRANKESLARLTLDLTGVGVSTDAIFDVMVKRIHEYKRQLLNILNVIYTWLKLKHDPGFDVHPRVFFFGGKAAPGYRRAKLTIQLICHVADMINRDLRTRDRIKVVFLPNYRVSLAERILPAADLSEQISIAGYEASGTSNMKFALNGALTIGTMDGANIEIMEAVGKENIFIFGLTTDEAAALRADYNPADYYTADPILNETLSLIHRGFFSPDEPDLFHPLIQPLFGKDRFLVLADFASYHQCQLKVEERYRDRRAWATSAILNVARMGYFSSDRTIGEYNRDIWNCLPLPIAMD
jgi:starch phosphorylase